MDNFLAEFIARYGEPTLADGSSIGPYISHAQDRMAAKRSARLPAVSGSVAVIPVEGVMTPKGSWFGPGTQEIGRAFDAAVASPQIGAVVFDMDTPGGMTWGTPELAQKIYDARGAKPIVAVANHLSASAGLYVGSAASKFYVAPSGHVGSLGVYRYHIDRSKQLEGEGVKVTFIHAAPFKVEGNPFEPLSAEAKEVWQKEVDDTYQDFLEAVAKHRGVSTKVASEKFGQGRTLPAKKAIEAGLVDRMATIDTVLSELLAESGKQKRSRDHAESLTAELVAAWNGESAPVVESGVDVEALRLQRERRAREVA